MSVFNYSSLGPITHIPPGGQSKREQAAAELESRLTNSRQDKLADEHGFALHKAAFRDATLWLQIYHHTAPVVQ